MIRSFADKDTEKLANRERVKRLQQIERPAQRKLAMLDAATTLNDLRGAGNSLEFLDREGKGRHSIRISNKWRLAFRWDNGDAYDVEVLDYH